MHENILELKVHFESKLSLIQWLDEEDWIKKMHKMYNVHFFNGHRASCLWFITHYQTKNNNNNNNNNIIIIIIIPPIKYFFS